MSNCAKLLCAAVFFFILATVTSFGRPDSRTIAHHSISVDKHCIKKRVKIISRLLQHLNRNRIIEVPPHLVTELKKNLTLQADRILSEIDSAMYISMNTFVFNQTECKRYFVEYLKELDNVETRLDNRHRDALHVTIVMLTEVLDEIRKKLDLVREIEEEAGTCEGFSCTQWANTAKAARLEVFALTNDFTRFEKNYSTYIQILLRMESQAYEEEGHDVLKHTEECILSGEVVM